MPAEARAPQRHSLYWARRFAPGADQSMSRSNQQHDSLSRDALAAPQKPEPLGRRRLHVDLFLRNLQKLGDLPADLVAYGPHLGRFGQYRNIGVADSQLADQEHVHDRSHEAPAVRTLPLRVGVPEVLPDVP